MSSDFYPDDIDWAETGKDLVQRIQILMGTRDQVGLLEHGQPPRDGTEYQDGFRAGYLHAERIVRDVLLERTTNNE